MEYLSLISKDRDLGKLWFEYEECETNEAKLVHEIESFECFLQLYEYERQSKEQKSLSEFKALTEHITNKKIKDWINSLLQERDIFWKNVPPADTVIVLIIGKG